MSSARKDIVHEAWHQVDRIGAEELLAGKSPGSFIFRKDEYASLLEEQFHASKSSERVICFTLTYREAHDHVVDRTIVCKNNRWFFYDDDPALQGPSYDSIYALLDNAGADLSFPVLNSWK